MYAWWSVFIASMPSDRHDDGTSLGETLELFPGAGTWSAAHGKVGFVPVVENWNADRTKDLADADYVSHLILLAFTSKRFRAVHIAVECAT